MNVRRSGGSLEVCLFAAADGLTGFGPAIELGPLTKPAGGHPRVQLTRLANRLSLRKEDGSFSPGFLDQMNSRVAFRKDQKEEQKEVI